MDHATIIKALTRLGEILWLQQKTADIAIYDGSAIVLQFDFHRNTQDVDAIIGSEHGAVVQAQFRVAHDLGLPQGWLNEGVAQYASTQPGGLTLFGTYPSAQRPGLRVYAATAEYLLAMKAMALRGGTQDVADAVLLAKKLNLTSVADITALLAQYYPNQQISPRQRVAILNLVQAIHAAP